MLITLRGQRIIKIQNLGSVILLLSAKKKKNTLLEFLIILFFRFQRYNIGFSYMNVANQNQLFEISNY